MTTSTSEAHVSSYQVKPGSPYLQKRRRIKRNIYLVFISLLQVFDPKNKQFP